MFVIMVEVPDQQLKEQPDPREVFPYFDPDQSISDRIKGINEKFRNVTRANQARTRKSFEEFAEKFNLVAEELTDEQWKAFLCILNAKTHLSDSRLTAILSRAFGEKYHKDMPYYFRKKPSQKCGKSSQS